MSAFRGLRAVSYAHSAVYAGLLAAWILPGLRGPTVALGWSHGALWISMSLAVVAAARHRVVPWSFVALVSVAGVFLGPFAGSWAFARETRRRDALAGGAGRPAGPPPHGDAPPVRAR